MGGESLQITFMPKLSDISNDALTSVKSGDSELLSYVSIAGIDFLVFTHSYMGIGMQAAQTKFDRQLITEGERSESVCYIEGDTRERSSGQSVVWQGKGDFDKCYSKLVDLVDTDECGNSQMSNEVSKLMKEIELEFECSPNGVLMPQFDKNGKEFYYIENFYYTAKVLKISELGGKNGEFYNSLKTNGEKYCSLTKSEAIKSYPDASEDEISKTCFCAAWLTVIIDKGFKLSDYTQYSVVRDINNVGIDWALGFLVQTSQHVISMIKSKQSSKASASSNNGDVDNINGNENSNGKNKMVCTFGDKNKGIDKNTCIIEDDKETTIEMKTQMQQASKNTTINENSKENESEGQELRDNNKNGSEKNNNSDNNNNGEEEDSRIDFVSNDDGYIYPTRQESAMHQPP